MLSKKNNRNDEIVFINVSSNYDNLGDLIINKCLIDEISIYKKVYLDTFGVPENFSKYLYEDKSISNSNKDFKIGAKNYKHLVLLLLNINRHNIKKYVSTPGPISIRNSFKTISIIFIYYLLRFQKVKMFSFGKDISVSNNYMWYLYRNVYSDIYVRSIENSRYLNQNNDYVKYMPDLAFLAQNTNKDNNLKKNKACGVSIRYTTPDEFEYMVSVLQYLIKNDWSIHVFYQVEADKEISYELYKRINCNSVTYNSKCLWFNDMDYYKNKKVIISNRLHVLIVGMKYSAIPVPVLGTLESGNKVRRIFESLGLDKNILYVNDYKSENKLGKIVCQCNNKIREIYNRQNQSLKETFRDIFQ